MIGEQLSDPEFYGLLGLITVALALAAAAVIAWPLDAGGDRP